MKFTIYKKTDFVILLLGIIAMLVVPNGYEFLPIIGFCIILISIYLIAKTRKNNILFYLMTIIGLINISVGVTDLIKKGVGTAEWQLRNLRMMDYDGVTAKSFLLFLIVFNVFLKRDSCGKRYEWKRIQLLRQHNSVISVVGTAGLYAILVIGIFREILTRSHGSYVSVSLPIYEYGVIVFCLVWFYSRGSKTIELLQKIFVAVYSICFLIIGDRSSVFMYVLLLYLLYYERKFPKWTIFAGAFLAIFSANFISNYRKTDIYTIDEVFARAVSNGLYVDTISWAYYAGIALVAMKMLDPYVIYVSLGYVLHFIGININVMSPTAYAVASNPLLSNGGGGMCSPYLYMIGGYLGVIIGASIMGYVVNKVFSYKKPVYAIYCFLLTCMSLRWYLYDPTVFFRTIFINGTILILLCNLYDHGFAFRRYRVPIEGAEVDLQYSRS